MRSYRNMTLSFRGSERQPPNNLQLALRFASIMEEKAMTGEHHQSMTNEERLRDLVNAFNLSPGLQAKHRLCDERFKAVLNIVSGTCEASDQVELIFSLLFFLVVMGLGRILAATNVQRLTQQFRARHCSEAARMVMRSHLDHAKWKESAFATDQLRSSRWMLGSSPKAAGCPPELKRCLTVTEESQKLHLQLVVAAYLEAGRRLRPSSRPKMRLSPSQWDSFCDYACMFATALKDGRLLSTWSDEKEAAVLKAFFQRLLVDKNLLDSCVFLQEKG